MSSWLLPRSLIVCEADVDRQPPCANHHHNQNIINATCFMLITSLDMIYKHEQIHVLTENTAVHLSDRRS